MERMKIGKLEKLVPNLKDKKTRVVYIKNLNQPLKHDLKLRKAHQVIRFELDFCMNLYVMLNSKSGTATTNESERDFL